MNGGDTTGGRPSLATVSACYWAAAGHASEAAELDHSEEAYDPPLNEPKVGVYMRDDRLNVPGRPFC